MARKKPAGVAATIALSLIVAACQATEQTAQDTGAQAALVQRDFDPPAAPGAFAPRIAMDDERLLMTWWEPLEAPEGVRRHRLMFASHQADSWSDPAVVTQGDDFFANWADFPALIREPAGSLLVHWLEKTAEDTFAYSIFLARSTDDGRTWDELGKLNDDDTHTEHGFVSFAREGNAVRAYWLDGRLMAEGGAMTVRSAIIAETVGPSELLDDRVCECCPTDAVETSAGSIVAYRDRSEDETREMYAVRRTSDAWSKPSPLTGDGWRIPGCPVNGPAVDYRDGLTAMAWFTAADSRPRVAVGFSRDETIMQPIVVDDERPLGRVGLVLENGGDAVVSWLALSGDEAELRLRRVSPHGDLGDPLAVARTSAARASGMPQLARRGDSLFVSWVEILKDTPSRVRVREIPARMVPSSRSTSR